MLHAWLLLQVGVAVAAAGAWAALRLAPTRATRIQRLLLLCVPCVLLGAAAGPEARPFTPPAQVWAPSETSTGSVVLLEAYTAPVPSPRTTWPLWAVGLILPVPPLLGLRRAVRGARRLRRVGAVEVWIAPDARTPFAAWWGRPIVVLDPDTALDPETAEIAIRHELQHHRNGDPIWAWVLVLLRGVSPVALLLRPSFAAAEELACDLAVSRRIPPRRYAEALLRLTRRPTPTPLAAGLGGIPLRWRLTMLLRPPAPSRLRAFVAALLIPAGLAGAVPLGWAADGLVAVHEVDDATFSVAAARLEAAGWYGADADAVRAALARLLGSAERRRGLDAALDRAAPLRASLEARLAAAGLPTALSAVPLVESGYRNLRAEDLPASVPERSRGAGYWMFIAPTARTWGLRVDTVDERLDLEKETTAAIALLGADHARYGDWALALAAYNQGEAAVDRAIAAGGSRDAFVLAERGLLNDYVAQVYAAAMVMGEPPLQK